MTTITKFLRYPGSKRRMLAFLVQYLPRAEDISGYYAEPFLGSGAVFFSINPKRAILADINPDLINLFEGLRAHPMEVWQKYCEFGETKEDYQKVRDEYRPDSLAEKAARVLYLNRTCFKGMWRTNMNGNFNVGYGGQDRRWVIDNENLVEVSNYLTNAHISCSDFEDIIGSRIAGDFLFLDPPYRPGEIELMNDHYIGRSFRYDDHKRLGNSLRLAKIKGVRWAMTTSSHPEIKRLFRSSYAIDLPQGTGKTPGVLTTNSGEVLITSYPIKGGKIL